MLVEDVLSDDMTLMHPHVDLEKETLSVQTEEENTNTLLEKLNTKLTSLGYTLSEKKIQTKIDTEILWTAVPIGLTFLLGFFILQKSGILNLGI